MTGAPDDELGARILDLLHERFHVPREQLTEDAAFADDLHLSSFERIQLVFELEELLGVDIGETEARGIRSVRDIVTRARDWRGARAEGGPS